MADSICGIDSIADQRYYHFLLWKTKRELNGPLLWRRIGDITEPRNKLASQNAKHSIHHKKLISTDRFARAGIAELLSAKGDGAPPFYYDVFVMTTDMERESYLMIGFPFVNLALATLSPLLAKYGLKDEWEQQCVAVPRLLPLLEDGQPSTDEGLTVRVVGIQWSVQSDASLTSIRLGGDAPLRAALYVDYLRPLARQKKSPLLPERCSLAFERGVTTGAAGKADVATLMRSRLHVDLDGSFRFYAQAGCRNIALLPHAVRRLWSMGCLEKARTQSPLTALRTSDGGE